MISNDVLVIMRRRIKSSAMNLVAKWGDEAEAVAWRTLSGDDLHNMLQAIKDARAKKEGIKVTYES